MSKLTLDEAIKHCLEVADKNEIDATTYKNCKKIKTNMYEKLTAEKAENDCRECAADHRQLAEWLRELVAYKKLRICSNCRHYVSGTTHFGECHVTSDIEPCVVGVDQTACDTFFDYKEEYANLNKISYGFYKELKEAKRLLKAAFEDLNATATEVYNGGVICKCCKWESQIGKCSCPDNGGCDTDYQWRYADEALKLLNDEK